jgi:diguanylate cyclase (GGDEF)-like protein
MCSGRSSSEDFPAGCDAAASGHEHGPAAAGAGHGCCDSCGQPLGFWAVDRLTGLLDRWGWDTEAPRSLARAYRSGRPAALLLVDLDRFKEVNDQFGHHAGDELLRSVARVLRESTADGHLVGRYGGHGGDEFLVLLPDTDLHGALAVAARIRQGIGALVVDARVDTGTTVTIQQLTASIGVRVRGHGEDTDLAALVMDADTALRDAKRRGRNRIGTHPPTEGADPAGPDEPAATVERGRPAPALLGAGPPPARRPPGAARRAGRHRIRLPRPAVPGRTVILGLSGLVAGGGLVLALAMAFADQPVETAAPVPPAPTTAVPTTSSAVPTTPPPPPPAAPTTTTHRRVRRPTQAPPPRTTVAQRPDQPWMVACPYLTSVWVAAEASAMGCGH